MMFLRTILFVTMLTLASLGASAQKATLKTNLISDALLSPNLGIEVGLAPKWTLNVSGQTNLWNIGDHKWRHWLVQPEARYWLCQRFSGHFIGAHAIGGEYNFGHIGTDLKFLGTDLSPLRHERFEGWGAGAGIAYGYAWPVHKHWNIEAEIGFGWIYTRYDAYPCAKCGSKLYSGVHNYVGPTKVALNIAYVF